MNKITVKHFFAGEHTTTWSKATGLYPERTCGHRHQSEEAAERCSAKLYPFQVYAQLSNGQVVMAHQAWRLEMTK